jgi:NADH:ubiquinone oxidoreductase subunit F (NADH-binding)
MTITESAPPRHIHAPRGTNRLFAANGANLGDHAASFGPVPVLGAADLIDRLQASGLTGRGGAGFATWRKFSSARLATARPVLVANGAEGEPLSAKDAVLLENSPHLVIDGMLIAGRALSAARLVLYAGAPQLAAARRALAERDDARAIELREAPDSFVSGEASAVVNALERGRAVPRDHVLPLSISGLSRTPTIVQNVETLAQLAMITRFGPDWFRSVGTREDPGTRLLSFSLNGEPSRVIEVAAGGSIAGVTARFGVDPASVNAVLVGGYHGVWVTDLATRLVKPGAGVLMVLQHGRCGIRHTAAIATWLALQSTRQCGPCANGLPELAGVLTRLERMDSDPALAGEVMRLAGLVTGRGSCHHPDGTARFALSSLAAFDDDVQAHHRGHCLEARQ